MHGIEVIEAEAFKLHCLHPATGVKIFVTTEPNTPNIPDTLQVLYELYSDYVMKNPFYEMDMPIKCELFEDHCKRLIRTV